MVRSIVLHIVLWFIPVFAWLQNSDVVLEISPTVVEKGQPITITIKTSVDGEIDMHLPDQFVQSGGVQSGMSSSVQVINGKRTMTSFKFRTFVGYLTQNGTFSLGPVTVTNGKKKYTSEAYTVKVLEKQDMISSVPSENMNKKIFGLISHSRSEVYEGEPIVVVSKIYARVPIMQFEDYTPFQFDKSVDAHALGEQDKVKTAYEVINGSNVQTFEIGKQIIFPDHVGELKIQPFKTSLLYDDPRSFFPERTKIESNTVTIKVKSLPSGAPTDFIGAVGKFNLSGNISTTQIEQGNVVELKLRVKGNGNLQNIKEPKLQLPDGISLYGYPEVVDSFTYCSVGAEGKKIFTYYLQINKSGDIQLDPVTISYFNPVTEKYESASNSFPTIHSIANPNAKIESPIIHKDEVRNEGLHPYLTNNSKNAKDPNSFFTSWKGSFILFSPLFLGFLIGFVIRKRNEQSVAGGSKKSRIIYKEEALKELNKLNYLATDAEKGNALMNIFISFLANYFVVEKGGVTKEYILKQEDISSASKELITKIMDDADQLRYSGGVYNNTDIHRLTGEIQSVIQTIG
ncbi:MAG: protein BatD [Brumimicrobium sp.]|nr:protein BatD [Brumimicrobium sp.]